MLSPGDEEVRLGIDDGVEDGLWLDGACARAECNAVRDALIVSTPLTGPLAAQPICSASPKGVLSIDSEHRFAFMGIARECARFEGSISAKRSPLIAAPATTVPQGSTMSE